MNKLIGFYVVGPIPKLVLRPISIYINNPKAFINSVLETREYWGTKVALKRFLRNYFYFSAKRTEVRACFLGIGIIVKRVLRHGERASLLDKLRIKLNPQLPKGYEIVQLNSFTGYGIVKSNKVIGAISYDDAQKPELNLLNYLNN